MSEQLQLTVGQRTHTGLQRRINEDNLTLPAGVARSVLAERGYLYVVADGVGGQTAGATASRLAVETVQREYYQGPFPDVPTALARAIEAANQVIQAKAQESGLGRLGTTLVAAVVRGAELTVAHVGDSRAYLVSQAGIQQLTEDHTWVREQQRAGILTEEEALQHSQRHVLTRSLGKPGMAPDVTQGPLQTGDAVLLCTDGLSNLVSVEELYQFVSRYPPQAAADRLIGLANQRGGPDNVTAVVVQVGSVSVAARSEGVVGMTLSRLSSRLAALPPLRLAVAVLGASVIVCLMTVGVVSLLRGPTAPRPRPTLLPGSAQTRQMGEQLPLTQTAALQIAATVPPAPTPWTPSPEVQTTEPLLQTPDPVASPVETEGTPSPVSPSPPLTDTPPPRSPSEYEPVTYRVVEAWETPAFISHLYSCVNAQQIVEANGLSSIGEFAGEGVDLIIPLPQEFVAEARRRHVMGPQEEGLKIAEKYGVAWQELVRLNCLARGDGANLQPGQMLLIP